MFEKTTMLAIVSMLAIVPVTMGASSQNVNALDELRDLLLAGSNGDLAGLTGTLTTYPVGGPVTVVVTAEETLAMLEGTLLGSSPEAVPAGTGAVTGNANTAPGAGWPYCDYASTFNIHYSTASTYVTPPTATAAAGSVCGYPASAYNPFVMNTASDYPSILGSCSAGVTALPTATIPVGTGGGYICGSGEGSSLNTGSGAALAFDYGFVRFDYWMGLDATNARSSA